MTSVVSHQKASNLSDALPSVMRKSKGDLEYSFRLYATLNGRRILGKGGAQILTAVDRLGSISAAAKDLQMSYRFVWNYLSRMEERLGKRVLVTRRGGTFRRRRKGGGGAELTPVAKTLLADYIAAEARLQQILDSTARLARSRRRRGP